MRRNIKVGSVRYRLIKDMGIVRGMYTAIIDVGGRRDTVVSHTRDGAYRFQEGPCLK
jgi:hypothetical protein